MEAGRRNSSQSELTFAATEFHGCSTRGRVEPHPWAGVLPKKRYVKEPAFVPQGGTSARQARFAKASAFTKVTADKSARLHAERFYHESDQAHSSSLPQSNAFVTNAKVQDLRLVICATGWNCRLCAAGVVFCHRRR